MNNEAFQKIVDAITEAYGVCAEEVIQYEIQTSKMYLIVLAILTVLTAAVMIANFIYNRKRECSWRDEERSIFVYSVGAILLALFVMGVACQIDDIYTAKYFPEEMLTQYIKHTISNLSFN